MSGFIRSFISIPMLACCPRDDDCMMLHGTWYVWLDDFGEVSVSALSICWH